MTDSRSLTADSLPARRPLDAYLRDIGNGLDFALSWRDPGFGHTINHMDRWLDHFALANFERSADTAHDLKTPLNVAVLNLELLRMRMRKVTGEDDERIASYAAAIETELRRMGRIFDAFFLLSTPPKNEGPPQPVNAAAIGKEAAHKSGFPWDADGSADVPAHESRIRQLFAMLFEGASKLLLAEGRQIRAGNRDGSFHVELSGRPVSESIELSKIFKFYYTDPQGDPDLSLAVARLIAETYGGGLEAEESETITLRLSLPLGAR